MRNVGIVIRREYLQRVRTRGFLIGTIAGPVILVGFVAFTVAMEMGDQNASRSIALVDRTGVLADGLAARLEEGDITVEVVAPGTPAEQGLRGRASEGELAGILEVDAGTLERGTGRWIGESPPSAIRSLGIRQALSQAALAARLGAAASEEELSALLGGGSLDVELLDPEAVNEESRGTGLVAGLLGAFILYIVILVYGTTVLRAVLEEKTTRIVEVIISSMHPWELMLGKVLGVGAVGLTQLSIWILSGALIVSIGIPSAIAFLPDPGFLDEVREGIPGPGVFAFFGISFLLGYFIYASLFAAVGAMCSNEQEAHQIQFPVVMLIVLPIATIAPVMDDPAAPFAIAASLFPFFSPILMFARVAAGATALWEPLLSIVLMTATLFATAWIAGRIYRVGILMQGKRPTIPELWRWIREA
ncbi:MAG: ABC transporter permease [Gemmatimonadota bacterium]